MYSFEAMPMLRRAAFGLIPSVALLIAGASASAQNTDASALADAAATFSSSTDGMPAAPAPAAEGKPAGNQDNSYGTYGVHHHSWASHLAFEAGGGANGPMGDSSNDITWGGNFTVGAGLKVNPHLAGLVEFQYIDDKLPGRLISEVGATGGNAHIWSLTLAPVIDLFPKRTNDFYVTGGGGFYRKVTNFTDPEQVEYCDYYYCGIGVENAVVGHFSSNQGGWNVGAGFTHRLGGIYGDGTAKLFAEARYLDILTPASASSPNGLGVAAVGEGTRLVPITLGVRF